jgi:hypothetical protein
VIPYLIEGRFSRPTIARASRALPWSELEKAVVGQGGSLNQAFLVAGDLGFLGFALMPSSPAAVDLIFALAASDIFEEGPRVARLTSVLLSKLEPPRAPSHAAFLLRAEFSRQSWRDATDTSGEPSLSTIGDLVRAGEGRVASAFLVGARAELLAILELPPRSVARLGVELRALETFEVGLRFGRLLTRGDLESRLSPPPAADL